MSKLICISDLHINAYTSYDFYPGFRCDQFIKAAERVVDIGKSEDTKTIAILGDLIDTPIVKPKTVHILNKFISTLAEYYEVIYVIYGQHDVDSKSADWKREDTIVSIFDDFGIVKYVNDQLIEIEGRRIYFHDWFNGNMSDRIPDNVDVLLTHFGISTLFGQEIDKSKFKIMIAGDIHAPIDIDNLHSVGGFLQKDLKDTPYGSAVSLDLEDLSFKRIPLINEKYKFLRIYNEGDEVDPDEYTWIIPKYNRTSSIEIENGSEKVSVDLNNFTSVINNCIEKENLSDIHKKYANSIVLSDPIDFNFKLTELDIENFRSIEKLTYDFERNHGNIYITGANGSGKTSFVNALFTALVGDRRISRNISYGKDYVQVSVSLYYQDNLYKIVRGNGYTEFYENGSQVFKNNKTALDRYIYERLPFLNYLHIFYVKAKTNYFYNFFNSKLINKLFNLDELTAYKDAAVADKSELMQVINEKDLVKSKLLGSVDVLDSDIDFLNNQLSELDSIDEDVISITNKRNLAMHHNSVISQLTDKINKFNSMEVPVKYDIDELDAKLTELKNKLPDETKKKELELEVRTKKTHLELAKKSLVICPHCNNSFSIKDGKVDIEKLNNDILEAEKALADYMNEFNDEQEVKLEIKKISEEKTRRLNLNKNYELYQLKKVDISESTTKLNEEKSKLDIILNNVDFEKFIKDCDDKIVILNKINSINKSISDKNKLIIEYSSKIEDLNKELSELNSTLSEISRYITYFDESSQNSIYKQLIVKISSSLSDDELSFTNQNTDEENLGFQLKVGEYWINYDDLSEGQKTYSDLKLLNKLFNLMNFSGLLILDEFTSSIDRDSIEKIINMIRSINSYVLINISHNSFLNNEFDHKIEFSLINNKSVISAE